MWSPIDNDCIKLSIYGQAEPQLVPKLFFQVLVIQLHNIIVVPPEIGGTKEAIYTEDKIIISDHSVHFQKHWTSKQRIMSTGYVLLNQSVSQ